MAKYIDAERFVEYFGDWYTEEGTELGYVGPIKDLVFRMPAADVIEIIRCKDCIYHTGDDECTNGRWNNWSNSYYDELYPEALEMDYCSYGVRKNG